LSEDELDKIQIGWIQNSSEKHFLAAFSSNAMTAPSDSVRAAIDSRLRSIYTSHLARGHQPPKLGKSTYRIHIPDIHEIGEVYGVFTGERSPDQQLVSKIGLRVSDREPWVHALMEKRLEQLWFFRELTVLAAVGYTDNAMVVSFSHESLPVRLQSLFPDVQAVGHIFLENIEDGIARLSDRTILLSVVQWLSQKRTVKLLRNLSLSTNPGHEVVFTFPETHCLLPNAIDSFAMLGFELVQLGELRLTPHAAALEPEKLEQCSKIGIMKRTEVQPAEVVDLEFFSREPTEPPKSRQVTNAKKHSYRESDLVDSDHSVVLHTPGSSIVSSSKPVLIGLSNLDSSFVLTFAGGEVAGFDVHPSRRRIVEIDGPTVSNEVIQATFALLRGSNPTIDVTPGMFDNYRAFLAGMKTQRPSVSGTKIRRV
jgi:hypothetical protein